MKSLPQQNYLMKLIQVYAKPKLISVVSGRISTNGAPSSYQHDAFGRGAEMLTPLFQGPKYSKLKAVEARPKHICLIGYFGFEHHGALTIDEFKKGPLFFVFCPF